MKPKPRKLQLDAMQIVDEIIAGSETRDFLFVCTPGAGKSALPIIFGKLIEVGMADAICWICPRKSLQYQGEENFQDHFFRKMFSHNLSIRVSTNDVDPCRGLQGFTSTYQALGVDTARTVLSEIRSKRYILVMDEPHHIQKDSLWEESVRPIFEAAEFRIRMTGTLERSTGHKVAFTKYSKTSMGIQPSLNPEGERVVTYTRRDALAEKAIIPLKFFFNDASTEWLEEDGTRKAYRSLYAVKPEDAGKALWSAISTDYSRLLIDEAVEHWTNHKKKDPDSKMLIATPNISNAKMVLDYLRSKFLYSDIATSDDTKEANAAIKKFKNTGMDILVGVAMFYEGFSAPDVSHLVSLTHIRSTPWIIQWLARAVRVSKNLPYSEQYAYVFTPDDPKMRDLVNELVGRAAAIHK